MAILPDRTQDLLDFFDQHAPVWVAQAGSIGVPPAMASAFATAAAAARDAYNDHLAAAEAARAAAGTSRSTIRSTRASAAEIIRLVKAYAATQDKPELIYTLAQIPEPSAPSPLPAPGVPTDIRATLGTDGSITLRWKAQNPQGSGGTIYNIRRKLPGESAPVFIGAAGSRKFVDFTIPAGTASVQYIIYGQRALSVGQPSAPFTVLFGAGGQGLTIAAQFSGEQGSGGGEKMAA